MTRTAADVQAEIDALEVVQLEESSQLEAAVQAAEGDRPAWEQRMGAWGQQLSAWHKRAEALKVERDRLARAELDAVTPPATRERASRLREAFYVNGGTVLGGADHAWDSLGTSEAAAWAAVAREAQR